MNLYFRLAIVRLFARGRRRLELWDTGVAAFRVGPSDLDLFRHMNNRKYLSVMDVGRVDLLLRTGMWPALKRKGWFAVVVGQSITYRKPLRLGVRFTVHTRIMGFDERDTFLYQEFRVGDDICAHAVVRTRFLARAGESVGTADLQRALGVIPAELEPPAWVRQWSSASRNPSVRESI